MSRSLANVDGWVLEFQCALKTLVEDTKKEAPLEGGASG
jgi:hypothetical protein